MTVADYLQSRALSPARIAREAGVSPAQMSRLANDKPIEADALSRVDTVLRKLDPSFEGIRFKAVVTLKPSKR